VLYIGERQQGREKLKGRSRKPWTDNKPKRQRRRIRRSRGRKETRGRGSILIVRSKSVPISSSSSFLNVLHLPAAVTGANVFFRKILLLSHRAVIKK
jgi:hypothetical protein